MRAVGRAAHPVKGKRLAVAEDEREREVIEAQLCYFERGRTPEWAASAQTSAPSQRGRMTIEPEWKQSPGSARFRGTAYG
jgi:hypothetical protein